MHRDLLVETMGSEPLLVSENSRPRCFRRLSSALRGAERRIVAELVEKVRLHGQPETMGIAGVGEYSAVPINGLDNTLMGVRVVSADVLNLSECATAGFEWELADHQPPRLFPTPEFLSIIDMPEVSSARVEFHPVDFLGRISRLDQLSPIWEDILAAQHGSTTVQSLAFQSCVGQSYSMTYAHRGIATSSGIKVRSLCQVFPADLPVPVTPLDMALASSALRLQGLPAAVVDLRWPTTCVLKWLTPDPMSEPRTTPGLHGSSILQRVGAGAPVMRPALTDVVGSLAVHTTVRIPLGPPMGWFDAPGFAQLIEPIAAPNLALAILDI